MSSSTLMAGAAQIAITPTLPVHLLGYAYERMANRVRDDIYAKVLVLDDGSTKLVMASCDLALMTALVSLPLKQLLLKEHGIPERNILICATHTHTAPEFTENFITKRTEGYEAFLVEKIAAAVQTAMANLFPATLEIGAARAEALTMNRLFRLKDGREIKGRGPDVKDNIIGPAGPVDDLLTTICLRDADGNIRGMAVNFAAHPDSIGGGEADFISADWPGMMAAAINAACGTTDDAKFPCLLLQGCCGDINPSEVLSLFKCGREARTRQFATGVAGAALLAMARAQPVVNPRLQAAITVARVPYYTRDAEVFKRIAELKGKNTLNEGERLWLKRAENWAFDGQTAETIIQCFRIGDLALAAFPNEIFTALSLKVQQLSPAAQTITVELSNHMNTIYVSTLEQACKGAYGTAPITSRWLSEDAGEIYTDCAVELLWRMWDGE